MSERDDIMDGSAITPSSSHGLIYTCLVGWVDVGHASPFSSEPTVGARHLWLTIRDEKGSRSPNGLWHKVTLKMAMRKFGRESKEEHEFAVRLGLSLQAKESVALAIFMSVSVAFEGLQANYAMLTNSSFSAEDLVSNLIGFYRAVRPGGIDFIKRCKPVSKEAALAIWDAYGAVGRHKVREFRPLLFPCPECPGGVKRRSLGQLPQFLNDIRPAAFGTDYRPWKIDDPRLTEAPAAAPAPAPPAAGSILTTVTIGEATRQTRGYKYDSLSRIAKDLYGDVFLWPIIFDYPDNRGVIGTNPNLVRNGQRIAVPSIANLTPAAREEVRKRGRNWK